ncbi:hypothetical protein MNB_SV-15-163 [hydrothermal vent metagenome]|uniref:Uncharacterized protein n=1 Tax=hydrothermal vent metagenome TaxID=652676 RepID=A0A1W1ELE4_9ZZZZ
MFNRFIYRFLIFNIFFIKTLFALDSDLQPVVFEDSAELIPAGSIFYYHVKLKNNTATATNSEVNLTVTMPKGFEYNSTNFSECSYSGATPSEGDSTTDIILCEFSSFSGNESKDINITVKAGISKGVFKSIATAYYDGDVNNANDSENVKTTVVESADVELVSYDAINPIIPSSGIVTYKMVVANHGPFATTDINFETKLPTGLEFYSDDATSSTDDDANWDCSATGQSVTCNRDSLDIDDIKTFYFRAKSVSSILGDLGQDASVTSDNTIIDNNLNNNINDVNITIIDGTNVAINKKLKPKTVLENEVARFELEVTNIGYRDAQDVVVTDTVDSDFPIFDENITAPANWSCTIASQTLTCAYDGNMSANYNDTIEIAIQAPDITDNENKGYSNTANITTTSTDTNPDDDTSNIDFTIWVDQADVTISKDKSIKVEPVEGNPVVEGEIMVSKIIVSNSGPREATPVQIFDDLDDNETFYDYNGTDWNCSVSGQRVTCDYNEYILRREESTELIIETKATSDGDIQNCASINNDILIYPDVNSSKHIECKTIEAKAYPDSADIEVIKDSNDTVVTSDEDGFEYYIDIKNSGPAKATNIKFRDVIPQYIEAFGDRKETNITAETNSSDNSDSCIITNAEVNCTINSIDVNDSIRVIIGVYGAKAVGMKENNATAFSSDVPDSNRSNNKGKVTVNVESTADIMVSKNDVTFASDDEFIYAGTNALYTIQVINNGSAEAKDVNLTNKFIGEDFTIIEFSDNRCTLAGDNRSFSCDLGDMAYKESQTVQITIRPTHKLSHNIPWDINNSATVTMSTIDSNLSNNEKNETLPIKDGEVDISIEKDESPLFIEPLGFNANDTDNNRIVYKITVTNFGPSVATNVKLVDKMIDVFPNNEQNMTFLGDSNDENGTTTKDFYMCVEPTNNNFNPNSIETTHEINCTIPNIESGDEFVRYFTFQYHDAPHRVMGDVYHNDINVTTDEIERESDNNHEDEKTTVRTFVDLDMKKTASLNSVEVGEDFNFTFDIYNDGPGYATTTEVTDTLPAGMELIATPIVKDSNGSCSGDAGDTSFACDIGNVVDNGFLALEDNKSIQIVAQVRVVSYPSTGEITNFTKVTTSAPDKDLSNNEDNSTVRVYKPAKIGDMVWLDKNANGILDAGEIGIGGVVVNLLDENKTLVTSTITNSSGVYNFDINHTANYFVSFVPNSKYQISPQNQGGDDTFDSDINSSKITDEFLVSYGDNNQTLDAGLFEFASLGDRVWLDDNGNGKQDDGESGVSDINVTLYIDGNSTPIAEIETNSTGEYLFENLIPNNYFVVFSRLDEQNLRFTLANHSGSDNRNDSDANRTTGKSEVVTLESGDNYRDLDAGVYEPVAIGDRVWLDRDANGTQDSLESNVSGVEVILTNRFTGEVNSTITDGNGSYIFDNLIPAPYILEFNITNEYRITPKDIGVDSNDSDVDLATHKSDTITMLSGVDNFTIDAGIYKPVKIGGNVWEDYDYNGIRESSENNISSVTVTLIRDGTTTETTTTTDENGSYIFDELLPNHSYGVKFSNLPSSYLFTNPNIGSDDNDSDVDITTGETTSTDIIYSGDSNLTLDAGVYKPIIIGNRVWIDSNANGVQDSGEVGVENVRVTLLINGVTTSITTDTNSIGEYLFDDSYDLKPNKSYSVEFSNLPASYFFTLQNIGSDLLDSDVNATGKNVTPTGIMYSNDENLTLDAGIYTTAEIGNRVWYDNNGNGLQDSGEANVTGVEVKLYKSNGIQVKADINGNIFGVDGTITTNENGYIFSNLKPDTYFIEFNKTSLPDGYIFTEQNITSSDELLNSDANVTTGRTNITRLLSGESDMSWDAGIYKLVNLGNRIWEDKNADGIQDTNEINTTQTITVTLYDTNHREANRTVTTTNGNYLFTNVRAGNYQVEFTLPNGYKISYENNGNDDLVDNDVNPTSKITQAFDIVSGVDDLSVDMGIYKDASLGDRVWIDANGNGIQDNNELNVTGVTVKLHLVSDGSEVKSTTTNSDGEYLFTELRPENYFVVFSNLDTNYIFTLPNQESNNSADSDVDENGKSEEIRLISDEHNRSLDAGIILPITLGDRIWVDTNANGIQEVGEGNTTQPITIRLYDINGTVVDTNVTTNGEYEFKNVIPANYYIGFDIPNNYFVSPKDIIGSDENNDSDMNSTGFTDIFAVHSGENNLSLDAGIFEKASIGDRIWYDRNMNGIQDSNEVNVTVPVTVKLVYEHNSSLYMSQVTTNGEYKFEDVIPNNYVVEFSLPNNYALSPMDSGNDDNLDSDVNVTTMRSGVITILNSGDVDYSVDMGIYELASIGDRVWIDSNANGIEDIDEPNYTQPITVTLYDNSGNAIANQDTINGLYKFERLTPASYSIGFTLPNGYILSSENIDNSTLKTLPTDLEAGENDMSWDMGIYQNASLGDRIWLDINANGIQDSGEANFDKEVKVTLYDGSGTKIKDITTTNGSYEFSGLKPNSYSVGFEIPNSYYATDKGDDSSVDISTLKTDVVTLTSGVVNNTLDIGIYQNASIGDRVWFDNNGNGVQDDSESDVNETIIVKLYDNSNRELASQEIVNGKYKFEALKPNEYSIGFILPNGYTISPINSSSDISKDSDVDNKTYRTAVTQLISNENDMSWDLGIYQEASIGDRIWFDINANGIQDINETNVNMEINVTLYDINDTEIQTITTNSGSYLFEHLVPNDYFIEFSLPNGYIISPKNIDNNITFDSDVNSTTHRSNIIHLLPNENNRDIDMGIYHNVSIGNRVWLDENLNGIQDNNEMGVENINVTLLDSNKQEVASTITNIDGLYSFDDIKPDRYYIQIGVLDEDYKFTLQYQGDEDNDSNVNINGMSDEVIVVSNENNITIDAGIHLKLNANDDRVDANISEIKVVDILANDSSNLELSSIELTIEGLPTGTIISNDNKQVIVPNEGLWSVEDGKVKFTPNRNFFGDPTPIEYLAKDRDGNSVGATIFIDYPPVALDDIAEGKRDEIVIIDVLENDVSSVAFDISTLRLIDNGKEVEYIDVANEGEWFVNDDGTIKFIPISNFKGKTTPVGYTVIDNNGDKVISSALIHLSYPEVRDDILFAKEGAVAGRDSITVYIFENDPIRDPDLRTLQIIGTPNAGEPLVVEGEGVWSVDGVKIIFTPNSDFLGDPTPIEYKVAAYSGEFSNNGKISIFYPLQTRDDTATTKTGEAVSINILENDNGNIDISSIELNIPSTIPNATISVDKKRIDVPNEGVWEIDDNGIITFIPSENCDKSPTPITYTVSTPDATKTSSSTIRVEFEPCNCGQTDSVLSFNILTILFSILFTLIITRKEK